MLSGSTADVEERLIGLGMVRFPYIKLKRLWAQTVSIDLTYNPIHVCTVQPWNLRRILVTLTPAATLFVANDVAKDDPEFSVFHLFLANAPVVSGAHCYRRDPTVV